MDLFSYLLGKKAGGGTSNYSELSNKPQINSVTLTGNKSSSDLGLVGDTDYATTTKGGVIKSADSYGTRVNNSGQLFCQEVTYENYVASNNNKFIGKGTLENVIVGKGLVNPTTYTGYDTTKTQVLKNVNGTLTWVDEN